MAGILDRIRELKDKKAQCVAEGRQLVEKALAENREMTAEENSNWDRCHADERKLAASIDALYQQADAEAREREDELRIANLGRSAGVIAGRPDTGNDPPAPDAKAESEAFEAWCRGGGQSLTAEQREIFSRRRAEMTPEMRALAGNVDQAGGFTVPELALAPLEKALKAFGGIRNTRAGAAVLRTTSGAPLPWPTVNDTTNKGRRIGETVAATKTNPQIFGSRMLYAYMYTSDIVPVSIQLLSDSAVNIPDLLGELLGERLSRIMNEEDTTGTGASMPEGVMVAATVGKTGASATAITWDEMYDLLYSVDPAYRESAELMFNDDTLKALKKLKDGQGRYMWQSGVAVREPDTIDRYRYVINLECASMASSAKPIAFGDFSKFKLRDVIAIQLFRFAERYMDELQVGFMAYMRHDAKLMNAGTGPIKVFQNAA